LLVSAGGIAPKHWRTDHDGHVGCFSYFGRFDFRSKFPVIPYSGCSVYSLIVWVTTNGSKLKKGKRTGKNRRALRFVIEIAHYFFLTERKRKYIKEQMKARNK
jgi:hypothetical protein